MAEEMASTEAPLNATSFTLAEVEALLLCDNPAGAKDYGNPEIEGSAGELPASSSSSLNPRRGEERKKTALGQRIGFRARSATEILNDGYRWRKYGKKAIKDSLNPRNYFRCSTMGCTVKKRVQRDCEDPSYVITIYDGVHNHETPTARHNYTD